MSRRLIWFMIGGWGQKPCTEPTLLWFFTSFSDSKSPGKLQPWFVNGLAEPPVYAGYPANETAFRNNYIIIKRLRL